MGFFAPLTIQLYLCFDLGPVPWGPDMRGSTVPHLRLNCILPHRSQWRRLGSCCPRSHRLWGTDCPLSSRSSYFVSSTSGWSCLQDVSSLLRCCCCQFVLKYQNYFYLNKQRVDENHFTVDNPLMLFYLLRALFDSNTQ